jgi:hypothetical protein
MKNIILPLLFALFIGLTSYGQEIILFPYLKKQIDSLAFIDQKVQQDYINGNAENRQALEKIEKETFIRFPGNY